MELLKKLATIMMAAMLAAAICVGCGDDDDDDDNDDNDDVTCSDFTTQDECEDYDECMWEFPDDSTDSSVYASQASDVTDDDDDDDDDAGQCVAVSEDDDDDDDDNDDDDLSALCEDACDGIIGCGYPDDATTCADDCETGALDLMGGQVADDADVLADFVDCMDDLVSSCVDYYSVWDCVDEACCGDEATAALCGLDYSLDCAE